MIAPNVIIIWPSTHASIPAGYSRETSLDGKHPKATADVTNPNITGGSPTHAHTSPAHTHTMVSHNHTGNTDGAHNSDDSQCDNSSGNQETRDNHSHSYNISGISGGNLSDTISYASVSSEPPYYKVIYIKAGGYKQIPNGAVVLWNTASIPTGFGECDGDGGRPDLRNKYLRGADTGADAGETGGTLNHQHVVNHTHSGVAHGHSGNTDYSYNVANSNDSTTRPSNRPHAHSMSLNNNSAETGSAYTANAGSADTVEPAYKKVMAIQSSSNKTPSMGTIALWLGTLATIPVGWTFCDGNNGTPDLRDKFIKIANDSSELGNTGGNNAHTHAVSNSHTHTASGTHTHAGINTNTVNSDSQGSYGAYGLSRNHWHAINSVSSNTSSWNNATIQADSVDGQPAFRTVAYIMFKFGITGGGIPMAMF